MSSLYDPLDYNGKLINGAAAMNARLKLLGGADKFAHDIAAQAVQNTLAALAQHPLLQSQPANDSTVVAFRRKRSSP
jgi:hypothetical protein